MKVMLAGYILGKGGIQSHLRWLARALGEAGIETLVLSLGNRQPTAEDLQMLQTLESAYVRVVVCTPYEKYGWLAKLTRLGRLAEIVAVINQFAPDVYMAVGTGWNLFLPTLFARSKPRLIFHEVMSGVPSGWRDSRWCVKWWFDEVVGQSPTVASTFAKCFGWNKALTAIPAMPEPLELTAKLPQVVQRRVELGTARAALFSRLVPHKQAFWLVQQWDELKDVLGELHIHGTGPEEALIREYIAAKRIGDRVKCFGRYPDGQAYVDLLSSYDLTLLPTIGAEGAPLVLLESIACGVPFVANGVGGIPDYGTNNPNVVVVRSDLENFVDGIKLLTQNLKIGRIDQPGLKRIYLNHYSYASLKSKWFSYLSFS